MYNMKNFIPKGKIRKFNEELYKKYDIPAREKIKQVLSEYIADNPDKYGADMLIKSDKCKYKYLELQVCTQWTENKYPHDNIFIWERKGKYNDDTLFLTFNKDLTMGYIFDTSKLDKNKPRRLKKYSREFVYDIPWNQVMLVYMKHLTSDDIDDF